MDAVTVLRELWKAKLAVAVVAVLAIAIGIVMAYRISPPTNLESREYHVGVASARALVDTTRSQVADLGEKTGADIGTLASRANLLASLMTSSPIRDEIAKRAGVDPELFITSAPKNVGPVAQQTRSVADASISPNDPRAYILRATVPNLEAGEIPIIAVDTQAPDADAAGRLANEAIAVLTSHIQSLAQTDGVPDQQRVVVRALGPARTTVERRGPARTIAIFVAIVAFGFGCAAILSVGWLVRAWRTAAELDRTAIGEGPELTGLDTVTHDLFDRTRREDDVRDADEDAPDELRLRAR